MDIRSNMAMLGYRKNQPLISTSEQNEASSKGRTSVFQDAYQSTMSSAKPEYNQPSQGVSFVDTVKGMAQSAVSTLKKSEAVSYAGLDGKADAQAVVQAMTNAEMTLKTALSIRDKVVEAYQEILRMPI